LRLAAREKKGISVANVLSGLEIEKAWNFLPVSPSESLGDKGHRTIRISSEPRSRIGKVGEAGKAGRIGKEWKRLEKNGNAWNGPEKAGCRQTTQERRQQ
jgi:hypothetical protein